MLYIDIYDGEQRVVFFFLDSGILKTSTLFGNKQIHPELPPVFKPVLVAHRYFFRLTRGR